MYKMKFSANELPYRDFEKVGLSKKDVLALPVDSLNALLSGRRSDFIRINADGMKLDVKTSLQRNPDSSVSLKFHPINHLAHNVYNLTEAQEKFLQTGEAKGIVIESKKQNGEPIDVLVQYDSDTKEYVSINVNDIPLPEKINDVKLTDQQRSDWKNGKEIIVDGEPARLSLTNTMGFVGKIFMFALDGGISIAIAAIVKEYQKREAERNPGTVRAAVASSNEVASNKNQKDNSARQSTVRDSSDVVQAVREKPASNERVGILVDHGPAPFKHDPQEKASYFVVLNQNGKDTTVWGVGLKDAIEKSGVERGSEISLKSMGKQSVEVDANKRDGSGNVVGTEKIVANRNEWKVDDVNMPSKAPDNVLQPMPSKSQADIIPLATDIKNPVNKVPDNVLPTQVKSQADVIPLVADIKNPVESNLSPADKLTPENILVVVANNTYNTRNEVSSNLKVGDNITFMTQMGERTGTWDGEFFQTNMGGGAELDFILPVESSWGYVRNDSQIQRELGTNQNVGQLVNQAEWKVQMQKEEKSEKNPELKSVQKSESSDNKETQATKNSPENQSQQNEWKQAERSQRGIKR